MRHNIILTCLKKERGIENKKKTAGENIFTKVNVFIQYLDTIKRFTHALL